MRTIRRTRESRPKTTPQRMGMRIHPIPYRHAAPNPLRKAMEPIARITTPTKSRASPLNRLHVVRSHVFPEPPSILHPTLQYNQANIWRNNVLQKKCGGNRTERPPFRLIVRKGTSPQSNIVGFAIRVTASTIMLTQVRTGTATRTATNNVFRIRVVTFHPLSWEDLLRTIPRTNIQPKLLTVKIKGPLSISHHSSFKGL